MNHFDEKSFKRIAVRMPNWLGDAIMATPVIDQIKQLWPQCELTLLGPTSINQIFQSDPRVSHTIALDSKSRKFQTYFPWSNLNCKLRREGFELIILLTNSFSSAWQAFLAQSSYTVGFIQDARSYLLTHPVDFPLRYKDQHLVLTYQHLLKAVSVKAKDLPSRVPQLLISDENKAQSALRMQKMAQGKKIIGLNPSSAYGPAKEWPLERFRKLAQELEHHGYSVVVFGEASSYEKGNFICQGLSHAFNLAGKTTLKEFLGLLNSCDLVVANDSGPMHLAAALHKPLVALFGSTDDRITGPYQTGKVIHKRVTCSPCFLRHCPIDFRCMKSIEVDEVKNLILDLLEKNNETKFTGSS
jgi:heptosyltransferase-2